MSQHETKGPTLPPPFFEWVAGKRAGDNPRGDLIRDTRSILKQGDSEAAIQRKLDGACPEALSEYRKLQSEYRRRFGTDPSDPNYKHQRERAMGLSWSNIRWRVLPYVVYICRNGNIVLANRRYLPLWVWEREPHSLVGTPDWNPVNKPAFVQGIIMSLHTYNDGNCDLSRGRMIAHVKTKLDAFHLGGLPPYWEQHRQSTDRKAWDALHSPPDSDDDREGITLDYN